MECEQRNLESAEPERAFIQSFHPGRLVKDGAREQAKPKAAVALRKPKSLVQMFTPSPQGGGPLFARLVANCETQ